MNFATKLLHLVVFYHLQNVLLMTYESYQQHNQYKIYSHMSLQPPTNGPSKNQNSS